MVRSWTRRQRGGLFSGLAARAKQMAAQTPFGQAAAQMMRDMRQPYGPAPVNPYGRSAGPVAAPVPVATPVAAPVAAPVPVATPVAAPQSLSVMGRDVVSDILFQLDSGRPFTPDDYVPKSVAKEGKKQVKNRDRNLALLEAVGTLSKEVKALLDTKPAQTVPFESVKVNLSYGKNFTDFQKYEALTKPEFRAEVAQGLVTAQDPPGKPNERRFLPGVINQLATAIRGAMQKELLLGGRTRRNRKLRRSTRRGGAGFADLLALAETPQGQQAFQQALRLGKQAATSPEARALAGQAFQGAKAAYASPQGQALKREAMSALSNPEMRRSLLQSFMGGKTRRSRRRL